MGLVGWRIYKIYLPTTAALSNQENKTSQVHVLIAKKTRVFEPIYYYGRVQSRESDQAFAETKSVLAKFIAFPGAVVEKGEALVQLKPLVSGFLPTILHSPRRGVFLESFGNTGDVIDAGEPVLSVGDPNDLVIHANLASEDLIAAKDQAFVPIKDPNNPDQALKIPLTALFVAPAISPNSAGHLAKFKFNCSSEQAKACNQALKINEIVEMVVEKAPRETILVPLVALREDRRTLFVLDDKSIAHLREVSLGKTYDKEIEIIDGLSEGETYVKLGAPRPKDGQAVEIIKQDVKAAPGELSKRPQSPQPG